MSGMTPLADEIVWILRTSDEALLAESVVNVLDAIGYGTVRVPVGEVESALEELMTAGLCERQYRRGRCYYAAIPTPKTET